MTNSLIFFHASILASIIFINKTLHILFIIAMIYYPTCYIVAKYTSYVYFYLNIPIIDFHSYNR